MASAAMNVPSIFAFGCIPFVLNFTSLIIRDKHSRIKVDCVSCLFVDSSLWDDYLYPGFCSMGTFQSNVRPSTGTSANDGVVRFRLLDKSVPRWLHDHVHSYHLGLGETSFI